MALWHNFLYSLQLPKKQAIFRLNRSGMDIAIIYVLLWHLLVSIPTILDMLSSGANTFNINLVFWLVYFFFIYYLPVTIALFIVLTVIAYIGTLIAKLLQRKLKLPILLKMSAYTLTIPAILFTITRFIKPSLEYYLSLLTLIYIFVLLIKIITVYPKRRKKPRTAK